MKKTLLLGIPFLFLTPLSLFALSDLTLATNAPLAKESLILVEASSAVEASSSTSTLTECSQQAIEDRDTAIANSRTLYNNAMTKALTERKNREKAAIAMKTEEERKIAIKASVENYKNQAKAAQNALTQARKLAWQTFENDIGK